MLSPIEEHEAGSEILNSQKAMDRLYCFGEADGVIPTWNQLRSAEDKPGKCKDPCNVEVDQKCQKQNLDPAYSPRLILQKEGHQLAGLPSKKNGKKGE